MDFIFSFLIVVGLLAGIEYWSSGGWSWKL